MVNEIKIAWQETRALFKINLIIYLIQLFLAFGIGMQVWQVMEASIGDSLLMHELDQGFSRTVFEDFLQVHGASVSPLLGLIRWIVPLYMIISIFLHAGLLHCLISKSDSVAAFLKGGTVYFFPSAKIVLLFLLKTILWALIVFGIYGIVVKNPIETFSTEIPFIWSLVIVLLLFLLGLILLWLSSLIARIIMISELNLDKNYVYRGWKCTFSKLKKLIVWFCICLLLWMLIFAIYKILNNYISGSSTLFVFLIIICQQIFVFARIGLRTFVYSGLKNIVSKNNVYGLKVND